MKGNILEKHGQHGCLIIAADMSLSLCGVEVRDLAGSEYADAEVGRETMTAFGYPTRSSFVKAVSAEVYAHFPERSSELQTRVSPASAWGRAGSAHVHNSNAFLCPEGALIEKAL